MTAYRSSAREPGGDGIVPRSPDAGTLRRTGRRAIALRLGLGALAGVANGLAFVRCAVAAPEDRVLHEPASLDRAAGARGLVLLARADAAERWHGRPVALTLFAPPPAEAGR